MKAPRRRAVVIGSSVAGMLAARVLAERYSSVLVVDRDDLSGDLGMRKGLPQARHTHLLHAGGRAMIESLLPGITRSLVRQGALVGDALADVRRFSGGGYFCNATSGLSSLFVSRSLLDREIARRLSALAGVEVRGGLDVVGVRVSNHSERVVGVDIVDITLRGRATAVDADLVVDASGRGSRMPAWLASLGYEQPAEERIPVRLGFSTRLYRRTSQHCNGMKAIAVGPTRDNRRGAALVAQEDGRWIVTVAGYCGDYPPTDPHGFLAFSQKLPTSDIFEVLSVAEPLGPAFATRFPANMRRRYENLRRFPLGLIVIGDSIAAFNPFAGQGMAVCAAQAIALARWLDDCCESNPGRYLTAAARIVDVPWMLTAFDDSRLVNGTVRGSIGRRSLLWYLEKLQIASHNDPLAARAYLSIANLVVPMRGALRPRLAWAALGAVWAKKPTRIHSTAVDSDGGYLARDPSSHELIQLTGKSCDS